VEALGSAMIIRNEWGQELRDEVRQAVHDALVYVWRHSIKRQELLVAGYGDFLQKDNYIGAPLGLNDLFQGVQREVSDATPQEILEVLDHDSRWLGDRIEPYGRGTFSYRLLSTYHECNFLIRFGEHPNNGIMYLWTPEEKPQTGGELEDYLDGSPIEELDFDEVTGGISGEIFASAVEEALRTALETLEEGASFGFQSVAAYAFNALAGSDDFDELPNHFDSLVLAQITSWSQRLLQVNYHSDVAWILVFDAIRLPSGGCYITEWNDNEEVYLVAKVEDETPEGIYTLLKAHLLPWLEPKTGEELDEVDKEWAEIMGVDQSRTRYDFVILNRLIKGDQEYPIHEDSFWRDLLGFKAISVNLPKLGLIGKMADYVGR
jgi:hypothetical protein